ncbi:MAG: hypothetical protein KC912_05645 [Proteobacteria bacterium]|nr:hypothetical protein [Pseudomonadota bacterium]
MRSIRTTLTLCFILFLPAAAWAEPDADGPSTEEAEPASAPDQAAEPEEEAEGEAEPNDGQEPEASEATDPAPSDAAEPDAPEPAAATVDELPDPSPAEVDAEVQPSPAETAPHLAVGARTPSRARNPPNRVLLATAGGLLVATAVTYGIASKNYNDVFSAEERNYDDFEQMRRKTNTLTGVTAGLAVATAGTGLTAFLVGEF